ncbi:MAG: hypothetical protein IPL87_03115 [Candidatus Moraniibacteriota bacterium]|nr:MAG: hypothetical protein IPL87_03115 [Candidatus Moranbacteria bacterium]
MDKQERTLIHETPQRAGERVRLLGWVNMRRDHGKILFLDLRDRTGVVQVVVIPDHEEAYEAARAAKNECVIEVFGTVKVRPGGAARIGILGGIEIEADSISIISSPRIRFRLK